MKRVHAATALVLAGIVAGVYPSLGDTSLRQAGRQFLPSADRTAGDELHAGWVDAVRRVRTN